LIIDNIHQHLLLKLQLSLSKQEILTEMIRISAHHDEHHSNDSVRKEAVLKSIHEISRELIGKQKRLLALLLDSGIPLIGGNRRSHQNF
jgi:hypothetical protein